VKPTFCAQYAYASLRPRRDSRLTLASLDYDVVARYDHPRRMKLDGNLDLIKAVVRAFTCSQVSSIAACALVMTGTGAAGFGYVVP